MPKRLSCVRVKRMPCVTGGKKRSARKPSKSLKLEKGYKMKTKITWFDKLMAAVTFAEANEGHTGEKFLTGSGRKSERQQKCKECNTVLATDLHGAEVRS